MEISRHWRLKKIRYGLRVEVDQNGRVMGNVPISIRDHVEQQFRETEPVSQTSAEALMFEALVNSPSSN